MEPPIRLSTNDTVTPIATKPSEALQTASVHYNSLLDELDKICDHAVFHLSASKAGTPMSVRRPPGEPFASPQSQLQPRRMFADPVMPTTPLARVEHDEPKTPLTEAPSTTTLTPLPPLPLVHASEKIAES